MFFIFFWKEDAILDLDVTFGTDTIDSVLNFFDNQSDQKLVNHLLLCLLFFGKVLQDVSLPNQICIHQID